MDRRSFLTKHFFTAGSNSNAENRSDLSTMMAPPPLSVPRPTTGLSVHTGTWTYQKAAHLLKRSLFGAKQADITNAVKNGMNKTVDALIANTILPTSSPINYEMPTDLRWVNSTAPYNYREQRQKSLKAWYVGLMYNQGVSLREKMTLFLHNHFVVSMQKVEDPRLMYEYINLLRNNSLGNFKKLVVAISTNAAMLEYLSGNRNKKGSPNEDYARELMELFTLGRVDVNGAPNYTEDDVIEAAKALTGWTTNPNATGTLLSPFSGFNTGAHDSTQKNFSSHFGNKSIRRLLPTEYRLEVNDLIDLIFTKPEVSLNICRELYRWLVYYEIDATTEANVIVPLAAIFRANNYELKPVLKALLSSQHFYDTLAMGAEIKNPADLVVGMVRQTMTPTTASITNLLGYVPGYSDYTFYLALHDEMAKMQMTLLYPPNVAGWKAYYQAPEFYEIWVNTASYELRSEFVNRYLNKKLSSSSLGRIIDLTLPLSRTISFDKVEFLRLASNNQAQDLNKLVDGVAAYVFPMPITALQKQRLKDTLNNGLPDAEWTNEWYIFYGLHNTPFANNTMMTRINNFLFQVFNMAEYHLV